ncbi:real-time [Danaus plexippus plexippus]|uniref:Real-time n=1 Tax=Danaus plexippus plexippus TaxID=278856 RepID=A0A212FHE9_DANPL|nr:real-time [Danaus plexippus plexippus]
MEVLVKKAQSMQRALLNRFHIRRSTDEVALPNELTFTEEILEHAYERRFPNCPQIPVVIDCVITEDSWSADDSQRQTTRRCQLNVDAPYLLKKMIGVDYIYFIQKNHLDLKSRVLEIEATNETFASRVSVVENCRYFVHPENSEWTCFEQRALLDVKNFFGLENTVEKIAMKQYAANIAKGKELIEIFMQGVHEDGVKDLKPWSASDPRNNRELRRVVSRGTEPLSPLPAADAKRHSLPGTSQSGIWNNPTMRKSSPKMFRNRSKSVISLKEQKNNMSKQFDKTEVVGSLNPSSRQKLDSGQSTTKVAHRKSEIKVKDDKKDDDRRKRVAISSPDLTRRHSIDVSSVKDYNLVKSCTCDPQAAQLNVADMFSRRSVRISGARVVGESSSHAS